MIVFLMIDLAWPKGDSVSKINVVRFLIFLRRGEIEETVFFKIVEVVCWWTEPVLSRYLVRGRVPWL
jgi:hypothetical protein